MTKAPSDPEYHGFISPAVARLLQQYRVDLTLVRGSGKGGRVTRNDLLAYLSQAGLLQEDGKHLADDLPEIHSFSQATLDQASQEDQDTDSRIGNLIMLADLEQVEQHRQRCQQQGLHLTYSVFFTSAVIRSLQCFPEIRAIWTPAGIRWVEEILIGFCIDQEQQATAIPTLMGLEKLSLVSLAQVLKVLAQKAKANRLKPVELKPGVFTIENYGAGGVDKAFPVLRPQQSLSLGIGSVKYQPVFNESQAEAHPAVTLCLAYDRRIIHPHQAERFLNAVVECLQTWRL